MIIIERIAQAQSTQTWYQCTTCSAQRLLSADKPHYFVGSGQSLTSRFHAGCDYGPDVAREERP
jgi:hypothetical protein